MKTIIKLLFLTSFFISQYALSWEYKEEIDQMRGEKIKFASIASINKINIPPPYSGGSDLNLYLRKDKKNGFNIYLWLYQGQIPCILGCSLSVKFDDGKVERWSGAGASNAKNDTIFLHSESNFLKKLKKSKNLIIEVDVYSAGSQQFKFDVENLKWD